MNWFRLNRTLHRDIGYFCISFTLVFAVSGLALNHVRDINPNYIVERAEAEVNLTHQASDAEINAYLLNAFNLDTSVKASYWESPSRYKLFLEQGHTITLNLNMQRAVYEVITPRPIIPALNRLHLNEVRQKWVVFSDVYAVLLIYLAVSALFMVKGRYSALSWRRGWLVLLGTAIPLAYMWL